MKRMAGILILLAAICRNGAFGTDWYFAAQPGGPSAPETRGRSPESPLAGLAALDERLAAAAPGDRFFLKRGDRFQGAVHCPAKGVRAKPILVSAYGTGRNPIITDLTDVLGWVPAGQSLWSANIPLSHSMKDARVSTFFRSGLPLRLGRYPNEDADWGGYLPIEAHEAVKSISPSSLPDGIDWTGAEVVLHSNNWVLDRLRVVSQEGERLVFGRTAPYEPIAASYPPSDDFGFFMQDHRAALDREGEWCYDRAAGRVYLYSPSKPALAEYQYAAERSLMILKGSAFIVLEGIDFIGSNERIVEMDGAIGTEIKNCGFMNAGKNAVSAVSAPIADFMFAGNTVSRAQNIAIQIIDGKNVKILGNSILDTNAVPGMGEHGDDQYCAIFAYVDGLLIEGNRILNTGYQPIYFSGDDVVIRRNFIDGYGLVKNDVGGIYTSGYWRANCKNRVIAENFISGGLGSLEGGPGTERLAEGIYIDDRARNVVIERNVIHHVSDTGIYVHNARDVDVKENICFANEYGMRFSHDYVSEKTPVEGVEVRGNVLFSASPGAAMVRISNIVDAREPGVAFSRNAYTCPFTRGGQFSVLLEGRNPVLYGLLDWVSAGGRDPSGTANDSFIDPITAEATGKALISNGNFTVGLTGWSWWSGSGKGKVERVRPVAFGKTAPVFAARLSFSGLSGPENPNQYIQHLAFWAAGVFPVEATGKYRVRFKARSSVEGFPVSFLLRSDDSTGELASKEEFFPLSEEMTQYESIFSPTRQVDRARPEFTIYERNVPSGAVLAEVYAELEDIELCEVDTTEIDAGEYIRFEPNYSALEKTIELPGPWVDMRGRRVSGNVVIAPFSAGIYLKAR